MAIFVSFIVVVISVLLLQHHTIDMFVSMLGEENKFFAWVWSIGLDFIALWAWFYAERDKRFLLLSIPLSLTMMTFAYLKMSEGVSNNLKTIEHNEKTLELNENSKEVLGAVLKGTAKHGAHKATRKGLTAFISSHEDMKKALNENNSLDDTDRLTTQKYGMAVSLFLMMASSIVAISMISRLLNKEDDDDDDDETVTDDLETVTSESVTEVTEPVTDETFHISKNHAVDSDIRNLGLTRNSEISRKAQEFMDELTSWGNRNGFTSETQMRGALPSITSPFFSRLRETISTGKGVTENKMDDVRAEMKTYDEQGFVL